MCTTHTSYVDFVADAGLGVDCEHIIKDGTEGPQVLVTAKLLERVSNDIQALVECVPAGGTLIFGVPQITVANPLLLRKPIKIRPAMDLKEDGLISGKVKIACSPNGLLDVRYKKSRNIFRVSIVKALKC